MLSFVFAVHRPDVLPRLRSYCLLLILEGRVPKVFAGMVVVNFEHLFVVTGGPGSGKSTLVNALAEYGFYTMPEAYPYERIYQAWDRIYAAG
jgi:hypothetical protein